MSDITEIKKPEKLCKDCKYFVQSSIFRWCKYGEGKITGYSKITGEPRFTERTEVTNKRFGFSGASGVWHSGECGIEGNLWERKPTLKESVIHFFKRG